MTCSRILIYRPDIYTQKAVQNTHQELVPRAVPIHNTNRPADLHRLDAEMQADEGEDEALQILHEIVEDAEALRVGGVLHIRK